MPRVEAKYTKEETTLLEGHLAKTPLPWKLYAAIGAGVLLLIIIIIACCCCKKKGKAHVVETQKVPTQTPIGSPRRDIP